MYIYHAHVQLTQQTFGCTLAYDGVSARRYTNSRLHIYLYTKCCCAIASRWNDIVDTLSIYCRVSNTNIAYDLTHTVWCSTRARYRISVWLSIDHWSLKSNELDVITNKSNHNILATHQRLSGIILFVIVFQRLQTKWSLTFCVHNFWLNFCFFFFRSLAVLRHAKKARRYRSQQSCGVWQWIRIYGHRWRPGWHGILYEQLCTRSNENVVYDAITSHANRCYIGGENRTVSCT